MASIIPTEFTQGRGARLGISAPASLRVSGNVPTKTYSRRFRTAWLLARVHFDAFRFAPLAYLQGIGWRLRRLRLRSRNRLAALMGRSPHAYALWIERNEGRDRPASRPTLPIRPIIDCRHSGGDPAPTLRSLREAGLAIEPIVVGPKQPGTSQVDSPRDLAALRTDPHQWLLPIAAGDEVATDAFDAYAKAVSEAPNAQLIYADDDLLGPSGRRCSPHLKPDWNPELFEHHDFISGSSIVRADHGLLTDLPDDRWIEHLVRKAAQRSSPIHLPRVLHHRRARPEPVLPKKRDAPVGQLAPTVTVIVPTRNRHELLQVCLDGVARTAYPNISTIIIDNDSDDPDSRAYLEMLKGAGVRVLRLPGPFNYSALNNAAVREASSDLLCFLNNDVEMIDTDWLALLVQHAMKSDIGAVGARLLYPDGTIQHAGVFTGIGGGAGHAHRFQKADDVGYFYRASLPQRVSAVTGACMVVAREKFLSAGGFDEERFPVAFNDVDLCLKLNARGWQSFYEPRATLIHHESKSRGSDRLRINRSRFAGELAALKQMWKTDQFRDPYHHPDLSPFCEQFLIAV